MASARKGFPHMTRHILGWSLLAVLGASCDSAQPPIGCPVQSLEWSATYKPKPGNTCPVKKSETLGILKFTTPERDEQLSIKPDTFANLEDDLDTRDPAHLPYSLGPLAKASDSEGFCAATNLTVAEKHAPATQDQVAVDSVYRWSNVRILAIARAPGTQMVADLEYTENGCTSQYEVWAMWPGDVSCGTDEDEPKPDDSLCASAGTINPDFATVCDPDLLRCVPAARPPSLK